jgi:hypothetical protein
MNRAPLPRKQGILGLMVELWRKQELMNEQVQQFIAAVKKNGQECWNEPGDETFVDSLLSVHKLDDGSVTISDNYERFFSSIYRVDVNGNWFIRDMFSDEGEKPYSFECAMSDASILYTG